MTRRFFRRDRPVDVQPVAGFGRVIINVIIIHFIIGMNAPIVVVLVGKGRHGVLGRGHSYEDEDIYEMDVEKRFLWHKRSTSKSPEVTGNSL